MVGGSNPFTQIRWFSDAYESGITSMESRLMVRRAPVKGAIGVRIPAFQLADR